MNPSKYKQEKIFGYVFSFIFFTIAAYYFFFSSIILIKTILVGIILLSAALIKPILLKPFNYLWIKFGIILNKITSPIILGFIYFILIFLTRIYLLFFNKRLIPLKSSKNLKTYWIEKKEKVPDLKKQF